MDRSTAKTKQLLQYINQNDLVNVKNVIDSEDGKLVINSFDNRKYNNALILASKKGYINIISILLKNGADFNLENKESKTAIEYVEDKIKHSKTDTIKNFINCKKMLLEAGAIIDRPITGAKRQRLLNLPIKYNNIYDTKNECRSWMFGNIITETFITDVLFMICNTFIYIRPLEKLKKAEFQILFGFGKNCSGFTTNRIIDIKKGFIFNSNYISMGFYDQEKYNELFYKYKNVLNDGNILRSVEIIQKNWRLNN
jgi:hypothetical protein